MNIQERINLLHEVEFDLCVMSRRYVLPPSGALYDLGRQIDQLEKALVADVTALLEASREYVRCSIRETSSGALVCRECGWESCGRSGSIGHDKDCQVYLAQAAIAAFDDDTGQEGNDGRD